MKKNRYSDHFPSGKWEKIMMIMRLKLILMLCCIGSLSANPLFSQQQKIDVSYRNEPIPSIIESLKTRTGVQFFYQKGIFVSGQRVSVDMKDATLEDVLNTVLIANGYSYHIDGDVVVITAAPASQQPQGQTLTHVRGAVRDASGNPMTGVTVTVRGTTRGVATDANGTFQIGVTPNEVLMFSFIGKKQQEVTYTGQTQINVTMEDEAAQIDQVVVTGLFSRPQENYTGAARTFSKEDLSKVSSSNVLSALKSLDPSIQMPQDNNLGSNPNALPEITVRGGNSLIDPQSADVAFNYSNNPNTPLFILDGFEVPLQRINDLDINRVLSVVTLKDATATTIYGSRAANGVIVIETIPAEKGQFRVSYTGQATFEFPDLKGYDLLNAREKYELDQVSGGIFGDWLYNSYYREMQNEIESFHLENINAGIDFDWMHLPLRNAVGHKHSVYIEGGDDAITYSITGSYDKRNGVMKKSGRENTGLSTSLQYRYRNLMFKNELSLNFNTSKNSPYGKFSEYVQMNPYWAPRNADGSVPYYVEYLVNWDNRVISGITNPFYNSSLNILDESKYQVFTENFFAQWAATDWFKLTGRFAYTKQSDESDLFLPGQHTSFANIAATESYKKGSYTKSYGGRTTMEATVTGDISKSFGRHVIFASLGANFQEVKYNVESYMVEGFPNDRASQILMGNRYPVAMEYDNNGKLVKSNKPTGSESISRLAGYFANFTYTYNTRYLFDASFRYDGSSLFGRDKRFAPFFSLGVGWNVHNENFLKEVKFIDRLKLKYTYGYTGSQNFESYLGITTSKYDTSQDYRYHYGTYIMGYGNDRLQWQRTLKHNIGVDMSLFNSLNIAFNYFNEISEGSIATVSVAPSTGFTSYKENLGDITNKGWELYASFNVYNNPGTRESWTLFFNAFHVKGKIKKVSNMLEAMNKTNSETESDLPLPRYVEGMSTTAIWAVESLGIDPGNGYEIYRKLDGTTTNTYSTLDQIVAGDTRPDLEGTFGTNFEYKGWGANLFVRYRFGGQVYNQTLVTRVEEANLVYNVDRRVYEERWREPGDRTFFKGATSLHKYSKTYATSRFVQDDNLLSVESLSLYYRFNDTFNKKLGLSNTKVSLYMSDLLWLSTVKRERGIDYPFSRSFSLQLQFTF